MEYAQRLQDALPEVELITLDRCGHVPQQEAPAQFLEALGRALAEPAPSNTGAP
jgi:pimeloyl-ACP methyl ester carboxylesterase